jgi:hypothetical protein
VSITFGFTKTLIELIEQPDRLEIVSCTRTGMRVLFGLLALFPLIAPWELLIRIDWQSYTHPFFVLAAIISAGALALSALLLFAACAALDSRLVLDAARFSLTHATKAPLIRQRLSVRKLDELASFNVVKREWSDGAPSFYLQVVTSDAALIEAASSWSREEIESIKSRIDGFLVRNLKSWRAPLEKEEM